MARLASPSEELYLPSGSRFCDLRPLGYGSSGMVFSAVDSECDKSVAIKRVSLADKKSCRSALREIRILRKLQHENIVKIYDVIFRSDSDDCEEEEEVKGELGESEEGEEGGFPAELRTLCIVQELVDADLRQVLDHQRLSSEHVRLFAYQLVRGLKYLHSANVLHRDLKPENVLINQEDLVLKIGDFGMARIVDPDYSHKGYLTQNVSTQWYRSPEVVLQPSSYTKAIDLWSAGCILGEMVLGKPLFPGDHDLGLMMLVLDSVQLNDRDLNQILCTLPSKLLKNYTGYPRHPLKGMMTSLDGHALDMLLGMLTFDPSERITAEEALCSPYFKMYSCLMDEPVAKHPFHIESEIDDLPPITIKKLILEECRERTEMEVVVGAENGAELVEYERTASEGVDELWSSLEESEEDKDDEATKETCIDNAFSNRLRSVGNKRSESSEKNETEESEKSSDEEKETKWEEFKEMMRRKSVDKSDEEEEGEDGAVEKGSVESDNEGSEKSEADDQVSEKSNNQDDEEKRGSKEDLLMEKFQECNNEDNNKDEKKSEEGAVSKAERKASLVGLESDAVEKAFGDKLQKEKLNEQLSNRDCEDGSVRKKHSDENKEVTENIDILQENEKSNEKTLDECLELGMLKLAEESLQQKSIDVVLNKQDCDAVKSKGSHELNDKGEGVGLDGTNNSEGCLDRTSSERQSLVCNTLDEKRPTPRLKKPDLKEVLYVDIPKASASGSPRGSPRGGGREGARRNSLSPRERSVRPKKKEWFYTKH